MHIDDLEVRGKPPIDPGENLIETRPEPMRRAGADRTLLLREDPLQGVATGEEIVLGGDELRPFRPPPVPQVPLACRFEVLGDDHRGILADADVAGVSGGDPRVAFRQPGWYSSPGAASAESCRRHRQRKPAPSARASRFAFSNRSTGSIKMATGAGMIPSITRPVQPRHSSLGGGASVPRSRIQVAIDHEGVIAEGA